MTRKTFRALRRQKKLNTRLQQRELYVKQQVNRNTLAFYLRLMIKKYKERVFVHNLTSLAHSHFRSGSETRIFAEWRRVAHKRREFLQNKVAQIRRYPQSAIVLMNFIGYLVMPRKQHAVFDVLDFYSFCSIKKKFSPNSKRLARTIEFALKQRLRRIMHAWREHKTRIVNFKKKVRHNLMKRVFHVLDHNNALNYRLKLFGDRR